MYRVYNTFFGTEIGVMAGTAAEAVKIAKDYWKIGKVVIIGG